MRFGAKTYKQRIGLTATVEDFLNLKGKSYSDYLGEDAGAKIWREFFITDVKETKTSIILQYKIFEEKIKDDIEVLDSKLVKEGQLKISKSKINKDAFTKSKLLKELYELVMTK